MLDNLGLAYDQEHGHPPITFIDAFQPLGGHPNLR